MNHWNHNDSLWPSGQAEGTCHTVSGALLPVLLSCVTWNNLLHRPVCSKICNTLKAFSNSDGLCLLMSQSAKSVCCQFRVCSCRGKWFFSFSFPNRSLVVEVKGRLHPTHCFIPEYYWIQGRSRALADAETLT